MNKNIDPIIDVKVAIAVVGNSIKLAEKLGVSKSTVSGWKEVDGKFYPNLPPLHAHRFKVLYPHVFNAVA